MPSNISMSIHILACFSHHRHRHWWESAVRYIFLWLAFELLIHCFLKFNTNTESIFLRAIFSIYFAFRQRHCTAHTGNAAHFSLALVFRWHYDSPASRFKRTRRLDYISSSFISQWTPQMPNAATISTFTWFWWKVMQHRDFGRSLPWCRPLPFIFSQLSPTIRHAIVIDLRYSYHIS